MAERFDAIVLGMGPGGEVVSGKLIGAGKKVAVVERELIGGECGYPSKTLLRPPEAREEARRAFGTTAPTLDLKEIFEYRDTMIRHLDDSKQVSGYEKKGATVVKGEGRVTGPGKVEAGGRELETEHIIVATGSSAMIPPIEGLEDVPFWTNREATTLHEVPDRVLIVGGGPVGIETAQMMSRFGSRATLVQHSDRLINREDPKVGDLIRETLEEEGIDVRVGRKAEKARKNGKGVVVEFDDGAEVEIDVVIIGAGRKPRTEGIGLKSVGVKTGGKGLAIDDRCRLAEGLWAVGDVTGVMPFTHVAQYQGRIVTANILGGSAQANYHGIPRVVFSDPEIAAVGLTEEQARERSLDVATSVLNIPQALARPWTYEQDPRGHLGLLADRERRVLVGAWAVAPMAGEWIHQAATAIREEIPLERLLDSVAQFPTYSGAYLEALERLDL
jgi:dihydrolipoamide dehydrogenase